MAKDNSEVKKREPKKIIQYILSAVAFMMIVIMLLEILSIITIPKVNRVKNGIKFYVSTGYCNEPEDTIDAVILGNSNAYCGVSPMEMWNSYGYTSYNCGEPLLRMSDIYYKLVDVLKYQSPKLVLLEADAFYSLSTTVTDLNSNLETYLSHILPVFEYHDRWKTLTKEDFIMKPDYYVHISSKGYVFSKNVTPYSGTGDFMAYSDEVSELHMTTQLYFDNIYNLCMENGIQIIIFNVPSPTSWNYANHNGIAELAESYDVPYVDFNLLLYDANIDLKTDTRDGGNHLNHSGAIKVTAYLAKYLSDNYPLPDHRDDEEYCQWNNDYAAYLDDIAKNLQSQQNVDA